MTLPLPDPHLDDDRVRRNFEHIAQRFPIGKADISPQVVQAGSVTTGSIGASGGAVTVTWRTAFTDANYVCPATVEDSATSTNALRVHHLESKTATTATYRIANDTGSSRTGTLHAVAVHA
jgi:hypothetical protein